MLLIIIFSYQSPELCTIRKVYYTMVLNYGTVFQKNKEECTIFLDLLHFCKNAHWRFYRGNNGFLFGQDLLPSTNHFIASCKSAHLHVFISGVLVN